MRASSSPAALSSFLPLTPDLHISLGGRPAVPGNPNSVSHPWGSICTWRTPAEVCIGSVSASSLCPAFVSKVVLQHWFLLGMSLPSYILAKLFTWFLLGMSFSLQVTF